MIVRYIADSDLWDFGNCRPTFPSGPHARHTCFCFTAERERGVEIVWSEFHAILTISHIQSFLAISVLTLNSIAKQRTVVD